LKEWAYIFELKNDHILELFLSVGSAPIFFRGHHKACVCIGVVSNVTHVQLKASPPVLLRFYIGKVGNRSTFEWFPKHTQSHSTVPKPRQTL